MLSGLFCSVNCRHSFCLLMCGHFRIRQRATCLLFWGPDGISPTLVASTWSCRFGSPACTFFTKYSLLSLLWVPAYTCCFVQKMNTFSHSEYKVLFQSEFAHFFVCVLTVRSRAHSRPIQSGCEGIFPTILQLITSFWMVYRFMQVHFTRTWCI